MKTKHTNLKILIIVLIIIVSLCVALFIAQKTFWIAYSQPKYSEKEYKSFLPFKEDAESVNEYIIEKFGYKANTEDNSVFVLQENGRVVGLYDEGYIEIPKYLLDDFNNIKKAMNQSDTDFFIDVKTDRISYGGLSSCMYVYSYTDKAPSYYYYEGDGMHPEVFVLGDNWYLLKVNYR